MRIEVFFVSDIFPLSLEKYCDVQFVPHELERRVLDAMYCSYATEKTSDFHLFEMCLNIAWVNIGTYPANTDTL